MPRTHIIQSWVGAAEYDEGDTYNGEQIGNRNQKSIGVHITRSGDQWYANTKAYADDKPLKRSVQKRSAFQQACLADNNYERLQRISDTLDDDLESGALSVEDWTYAKKNLQPRIDRAWKRIAKNRGWDEDQEDDYQIESFYHQEHYNTNIQSKKTLTEGDHFINLVFNGLPDDNVFKAGFLFIQKMMRMFR